MVGLDLGTTLFRSLRPQKSRLIGRICPTHVLELSDTASHRRLLDRDSVHYAECDGRLYVMGDAASEWSGLLSLPARSLLADGLLPHDDSVARQILSLMVEAVLPVPTFSRPLCCLTIPGELMPSEESPERDFFCHLVRLRGYEPLVIGQGHATGLALMSQVAFSGLGISIGASQCEFSLLRSAREIARCAIPWGSNELDLPLDVRQAPEQLTLGSMGRQVVDFLVEILLEAGARLEQHHAFSVVSQPMALALSGGLMSLPGMASAWDQAWSRASWPVRVGSMVRSTDNQYTTARGCLIRATMEQSEMAAAA